MVTIRTALSTAIALVAAGAATPALAHPHAWIDAVTELHLNDKQELTAITVNWTFDPAYSNFAIEGLDQDGDGNLSPEELKPLAAHNLEALKDYGYFTEVTVDGDQAAYGEVSEFSASYQDLQLSMRFKLPLAEPVYVKTHAISYALYDPSYYVEILHKEGGNAIALTGTEVEGCAPERIAANLDSLPMALADLNNEQAFAEDAPAGQSYGAMFAERVHLICN